MPQGVGDEFQQETKYRPDRTPGLKIMHIDKTFIVC